MIQTILTGTLALALATAIIRPAAAADTVYVSGVVNFDSLPNSSGGVHMPTTYEGFTWGNDLYSTIRAIPTSAWTTSAFEPRPRRPPS